MHRLHQLWRSAAAGCRLPRDGWTPSTLLLAGLILLPLLALIPGALAESPTWSHLRETVLTGYVLNTLWLVSAVCLLSVLMAVPAAWLLSQFQVPGRRFLEWAMVLPLAIPTYVAAFVYMGVPEAAIPLLIRIRTEWGLEAFRFAEGFIRKGTLALLMSAVLYPYLYLSLRAAFLVRRRNLVEAAHLLGRGPAAVFFSVALPLARPALAAGLSLIAMEVLNDYGAVHFFGVPTLTEGIFRTWAGLGDRTAAVRLALGMMLGILVLLGLESLSRGRARFIESADTPHHPPPRRPLSLPARLGALAACILPLMLGFLLPLGQLIRWAMMSLGNFPLHGHLHRLGNSLLLSLITAAGLNLLAVWLVYAERLQPRRWLRQVNRLACLGYAVPGAVVGIGVMLLLSGLERGLGFPQMIGSVQAIGFAYVVRFLAVGFHPVRAAMEKICGSLDAASRLLGRPPLRTLFAVNLPLIRGTLVSVTMLVFIDILKELPLTMVLRPVNFDTLATLAFGLAKEGRIQECAIPSLMIVLLAGMGVFVLNRMLTISSSHDSRA